MKILAFLRHAMLYSMFAAVSTLIPCPISHMVFSGPHGARVEVYGDIHDEKFDAAQKELLDTIRTRFLTLAKEPNTSFLFESRHGTVWPHWGVFINDIGRELGTKFPERFINVDLPRKDIMACILQNNPEGMKKLTDIALQNGNSVITRELTEFCTSNDTTGYVSSFVLKPLYDLIAKNVQGALECPKHQHLREQHVFNHENPLELKHFQASPYRSVFNALCRVMEMNTLMQLAKQLWGTPPRENKHIILYAGETHAVIFGGMMILLGFTLQEHTELVPERCKRFKQSGERMLWFFGHDHPGIALPCTADMLEQWRAYWALKLPSEPIKSCECGKIAAQCPCFAR